MSRSIFRELVRDLMEADAKGLDEPMPGDSIDRQIDDLLSDYEAESTREKNESYDFRAHTRSFLTEDLGDEPPTEGGESDETTGDENTDLSMDDFASAVMRLVVNYDSLLDVRNVILKRAHNFLLKNHDASTATKFIDTMRRDHDVEIDKTRLDREKQIAAPNAERSGGAGGGA